MRHWVNLALLFLFATLVLTGVAVFLLPFSQTTTRLHVVSGIVCVGLVVSHVLGRIPYMKTMVSSRAKPIGILTKLSVVLFAGILLAGSLSAWQPSQWVMDQSYEARKRLEIVRASSLAGFVHNTDHSLWVVRQSNSPNSGQLAVHLGFSNSLDKLPVAAVWAESTTGTMIETLYLDESLAYSDSVDSTASSAPVRRSDVLPIWRHAYTAVTGIDPDGNLDGMTGATQTHQFALDPYLETGKGNRFVVCVELNQPADPNEHWTDSEWGQPSLLYTALIDVDREMPHAILELTGHGVVTSGSPSDSGEDSDTDADADDSSFQSAGTIQYDLDSITTARNLVDLFLAKLDRPTKLDRPAPELSR
ncbi:hypothetical protein [Rhodopirellula halodulae]|uniref:hypothetical protein n=1 Tax=Rhodopirellula halodulae TaxID=2894198 RepID=UPI001E35D2FD|nr:hypothetical protein [Rhodopirellula sp. JC737]MCC9658470.1 hypothetical protein [Rhodopirellula sp. JC737]